MKVLKFGGSSLADADCFKAVAKILGDYSIQSPISVVLSAPKGVTNALIDLLDCTLSENHFQQSLDKLEEKLSQLAKNTLNNPSVIEGEFSQLIKNIEQLLKGIQLLANCPAATRAQIIVTGEKFSVLLMSALLTELKHEVVIIQPEKFLTTQSYTSDPVVDLGVSQDKFKQHYSKLGHISLMPGFIGVAPNGEITTLGRNGSDHSAAILAVCTNADICEIWTDVDGVYNADPRLVSDVQLIDNMSYHEAMELSYFGAKVLHPKTISPLALRNIPCRIKNTFAPEAKGTLISLEGNSDQSIKAISNLSDIAMLNVSGPGMKGMIGMASRIFSAISLAKISVIMISQSSSEYSISFCIPQAEIDAGLECLNNEFELELKTNLLEPIAVKSDLCIITLVGDSMQKQKGIAAKFFKALSLARVNIIAIAQDSSEKSISAVIRSQRADDAIKVCHQNLFLNKPAIDTFIIGCGTIGKELIRQIQQQQKKLSDKHISLNLVGIANSKQLLLDKKNIDLDNWQENLKKAKDSLSVQKLKSFVEDSHLNNPVIVDCTSSDSIAMQYKDYLNHGFHVVTANKKANTANYQYYQALRSSAQKKERRFLYETNVGAGLPVIDNLQGLFKAGDQLIKFEGILSGSLSYIFGELDKGLSLSQATSKALELGFTEPHPGEDLSGLDVARKTLVIAREAGLKLELSDIQLTPVVPPELAEIESVDEFLQKLSAADDLIEKKVSQAKQANKVLRYVAQITDEKCLVEIQAVDERHPLYSVIDGENALALHTQYYQPRPLVIRGYGAGASVTAAGLFADLLRTQSWNND